MIDGVKNSIVALGMVHLRMYCEVTLVQWLIGNVLNLGLVKIS